MFHTICIYFIIQSYWQSSIS